MEPEMKRWVSKGLKVAQVGDWAVYGVRYESEDGEIAWHTSSYPNDNPIHHFWVMNGALHAVAIHYMYNMTYENRIWIGDVVANVSTDERDAVLQAIAKWETERQAR